MSKHIQERNKALKIIKIFILFVIIVAIIMVIVNKDNTQNKDNAQDNNIINSTNEQNDVAIDEKKPFVEQADGLEFSNCEIIRQNGEIKFIAKVKNGNKEKFNLKFINVKVYDKENNCIVDVNSYIGDYLQPKEEKQINLTVDKDISSLGNIEFKIVY